MPTTDFVPNVKGTATRCNMPSPRHSGNQDVGVAVWRVWRTPLVVAIVLAQLGLLPGPATVVDAT